MRLRLNLQCSPGSIIPFNYQYELSSWIYKTLSKAEPEFADWLHQQGYTLEGKRRFKFFTFSHFHLQPPFEPQPDRQGIRIDSGHAGLVITFLLDDAVAHFVTGLFQEQRLGLGNPRFRPVDFMVQSVEILPRPYFQPTMRFRALSPICIAATETGKDHAQYRVPTDKDYTALLMANLEQKVAVAQHYLHPSPSSPAESSRSKEPNAFPPNFALLSPARQKGVTLKSYTAAETKIIGYTYDFEITAAPDLLEIGYYAGFGVENAQGFGCVEIM